MNSPSDLNAKAIDALYMGDVIFNSSSQAQSGIIEKIKGYNTELLNQNSVLEHDMKQKHAQQESANRDFADESSSHPATDRTIHVIEDYTVAVLTVAYLFMVLMGILSYTMSAEIKITAFFKALFGAALITVFMMMFMYYVA